MNTRLLIFMPNCAQNYTHNGGRIPSGPLSLNVTRADVDILPSGKSVVVGGSFDQVAGAKDATYCA
jgi:hypothetical protein